jgi:hypothetical protein
VKHNHEHARRTTAALEGAINCWADPISVIDARSAAHDALFALARQLPALAIEARRNAKQGHGTLGWRGLSWQADALALCPETSTHATTVAHLIAAVETKTATCNRRTPGYPYNPNAWIKSDAIPDPLPLNHEATQLMEEIIRAFTLARAGYVPADRVRVLESSGVDVKKWLAGFSSVDESVLAAVEAVRKHPLVPPTLRVTGLVIDPTTGALRIAGTPRAPDSGASGRAT